MKKFLILAAALSNSFGVHVIAKQKATVQPAVAVQAVIKSIKWGEIIVSSNGKDSVYEDAKVWPTASKPWDWKATNTHHVPGIQIGDIEEFIDNVDIVILTRGMHLVLQVPQTTIDYIIKKKKVCIVAQTEAAVNLYNALVKQGIRVGGVFHSTC